MVFSAPAAEIPCPSPRWRPPAKPLPIYAFALANKGHDTRALQAYLGHRNIQHTVRYTELSPGRFKDFWRTSALHHARKACRRERRSPLAG
jgi:hypothetical protein